MFWEFIMSYENWKDIGISIGIFLLFLVFRKIFAKYVFALLLKLSSKAPSEFISHIFLAFERPFQWLFLIIGIYVAAGYFPLVDQGNLLFLNIIRSSVIVIISWGLFNLSSSSSLLFKRINQKFNTEMDEILLPFISKALRIIIVAISVSIIAEVFGYSISTFVAGLGIGGLAISLAAKDALANLFGGVVIITEKPFSIGDWIMTPSVEGTVEDISFRSTVIRTFSQALVTVPNATLANEPITNWSKMGKRQITFNLKVSYDTTKDQLRNVVHRIETLLKDHPDIHPDTIFVTFDKYMDNGLEIFVYFFTNTTNWGEFLKIKEAINFEVMDILESEGVYVALPTRKLYVDSDVDKQKKVDTQQS
ncbi:MscS family membrane protein [Cytobacillus eiseniae]|uniref:MscS family membrane protein n=1 Tax=Cytobacillus eiseniae TaxID=762947 RepID=A0ABS4RLU7_9BACI|nr:mechanosensitive ion channel family protein [Cytobacillus eiseniae]MBP2243330.1 MscS family membrane protein [Cytobacillus eiseniae]